MRGEGCVCLVRRRKRSTDAPVPQPAGIFAPNVLARNFTATAPDQKWVTDVTRFSVAETTLYLSPLIDLFNGEVISYTLETNQHVPMVMTMLQRALDRREVGRTILHSDRGWQYQHAISRNALTAAGVTQSMSRSDTCLDNDAAESFFSHFKQEFLRGRRFDSVEHANCEIDRYLH